MLCDDQLSFFDFEPPHATSPFSLLTNSTNLFSSWATPIERPLSPPLSALSSSSKSKSSFSDYPHALPNILTDIDTPSAQAQHGQITPPDDQSPRLLDEKFDSQSAHLGPSSESPKKRKRLTAPAAKELIPETPPKRTRKNAAQSPSDNQTVDANELEQVRRSRFLERNRVAASKCRQKKKVWIDKLELQLREQHARRNSLQLLVDSLKSETFYLKVEMMAHSGCSNPSVKRRIEQDPHAFKEAMATYQQLVKPKEPPVGAEDSSSNKSGELDVGDSAQIKTSSSPLPFEDLDPLPLEALLDVADLTEDPKEESVP